MPVDAHAHPRACVEVRCVFVLAHPDPSAAAPRAADGREVEMASVARRVRLRRPGPLVYALTPLRFGEGRPLVRCGSSQCSWHCGPNEPQAEIRMWPQQPRCLSQCRMPSQTRKLARHHPSLQKLQETDPREHPGGSENGPCGELVACPALPALTNAHSFGRVSPGHQNSTLPHSPQK